MKKIDNFFESMEKLFLEKDYESFIEMKEDLLEHIEILLEEGKTEDEVLALLGSPEEIVASFYEDQRLAKAMKAEKDIVAIEEADTVYKEGQKSKRKSLYRKAKNLFLLLLTLIVGIISLYLVAFVLIYAVRERHLAFGQLTLALFLGALGWVVNAYRKEHTFQTKIFLIGLLSLAISAALFFTNNWFFKGHYYTAEVRLNPTNLKQIDLLSSQEVEVKTVLIAKNETPKIEIKGYVQNSNKEHLLNASGESDQTVRMEIGEENNIFNLLKKFNKTKIAIYITADMALEKTNFDVHQGELNILHLVADEAHFDINEGDLRLDDVVSKNLTVNSENGYVVMNKIVGNVDVNNVDGKTILKDGQGRIKATSDTGLINLNGIQSEKVEVTTNSGKIVLSSSAIDEVAATNKSGTTVMENQVGTTAINNGSGKVVLTTLEGNLNATTNEGSIIVYGDDALAGEITSQSGTVKWVQENSKDLTFDLTTESGKINNEYGDTESSAKYKMKITTVSGDIRIIANKDTAATSSGK